MPKKLLTVILLSLTAVVYSSGLSEGRDVNIIGQYVQQREDGKKSISEILYEISNIYAYLDNNFLYEIDNRDVEEKLISGLVDSLGDKYSYYVPSSEADDYEEALTGEYVGIGTYLMKMNPSLMDPDDPRTYMIIISSTFPGGPADRSGLRANDLISNINGEDVSQMDAREASRKLRGKEGEELVLTVHRGDSEFEIRLMPEKVEVPTCTYGMLDDSTGYLQIISFAENTNIVVEKALEEMTSDGMDALVIDLRNNGGGTVDSALAIADMFLSSGRMISVEYKDPLKRLGMTYEADKEVLVDENIDIAILVNGGTASSSEILTASLMENDRAAVIGEKTFGKGIMQNVIPIGDGFIQFTSAHYLTPDGNDIHEKGIVPEIEIPQKEYTDEEMSAYADFFNSFETMKWVEENPVFSDENIDSFIKENSGKGVPEDLLKMLVINEYVHSMPSDERPVALPEYDEVLSRAISYLKEAE